MRELARAVQLDPNDGRAWYLLGRYAILAGDPRRADEEYLVRALVLFNKQRNEQGQADVHNAIGVAQDGLGRLDEAVGSYEQAATMRRRLGDRRGLAATLLNLGMVDMTRGELAAARGRFQEALALHGELDDPAGASEAHNSLGLLAEEGGDYPGALEEYRQALQLRKELGDERALAQSYGNVGYAYYLVGRYDDALLYGRQALDLYRKSGDRLGAVQAAQTVGACQLDHGELDEATRTFLETLREGRALEDKPTQAVAHGFLGRVAQAQGRYAAALASYRAALAPLAELDDRRGLVEFTLHEGETLLELGLDGEARARLDRVAAWLAGGGSHEHRAHHSLLRGVWASRHEPGAAAAHFAAARSEARTSHNPALELRVRLAAADAAAGPASGGPGAAREAAAVRGEATALGHALLRLRSAERLAALQLAAGDEAAALETLRDALALAGKGGSYARAFRLHELLAEALRRGGEDDEAAAALAVARAERTRIAQGLDAAQRAGLDLRADRAAGSS
jgi:tetratricopeptide (TPR) repeat protein